MRRSLLFPAVFLLGACGGVEPPTHAPPITEDVISEEKPMEEDWICEGPAKKYEVIVVRPEEDTCPRMMSELISLPHEVWIDNTSFNPTIWYEDCTWRMEEEWGDHCIAQIDCYTELPWAPHGRRYVIVRSLDIDLSFRQYFPIARYHESWDWNGGSCGRSFTLVLQEVEEEEEEEEKEKN